MELTRHHEFTDFYNHAATFLLEHEAEHNLILGITSSFIRDSIPVEHPPYLATVRREGRVIAVAVRTPPHNLVISRASPEATRLVVADVYQLYSTLQGVLGPRDAARAFAAAW